MLGRCTVACSVYSRMLGVQSHARCTVACSVYSRMLGVQSHARCTVACSVYSRMLGVPGAQSQSHARCTVACSVYSRMLGVQSHARCTVACTACCKAVSRLCEKRSNILNSHCPCPCQLTNELLDTNNKTCYHGDGYTHCVFN